MSRSLLKPTLRVLDEQGDEHQGDGGQELYQHVQGRPGGILERVAHGIADDGRGWAKELLPRTLPFSSLS